MQEVEELYYVAKTKALISCAITTQLICTFVFAYRKIGFLMTCLKCRKQDFFTTLSLRNGLPVFAD